MIYQACGLDKKSENKVLGFLACPKGFRTYICAHNWVLKAFVWIKKYHAEGVYIINSEGIAYHQHEVLYIIKPQGIHASRDDIRLRR